MAELLKGAPVAAALNEKTSAAARVLTEKGVVPTLALLRVGAREDDLSYERGAMKRCEALGVAARSVVLPEDVSQAELMAQIEALNADGTVHGVLMFRPLPRHLDEDAVCRALAPAKDVDGITPGSLAGVFMGTNEGYPPCTAQAAMEILDFYGCDPKGKRAVVVGRSLVVGKPVGIMLMGRHATVTTCHTRTVDMPCVTREAEILVVAAGKAGAVTGEYLRPGQVVIDVGINVNEEGKLTGDVLFEDAESVVASITPVPGGVGAVTTSVLVSHVVKAAERAAGIL